MDKLSQDKKTAITSGARLRRCREEKDWTGDQLAAAVNDIRDDQGQQTRACNKYVVSDHEHGRRAMSPEYAALYGQALGVDPDFLLCKIDCRTAIEQGIKQYNDDKERIDTINRIIEYAGYYIDYSRPCTVMYAENVVYYYIWRKKNNGPDERTVAIRRDDLEALMENIVAVVQCHMEGVVRSGRTVEQIATEYRRYEKRITGEEL